MYKDVVTAVEIDLARKQLENIAQQCDYDFNHPDVIAISQKLDSLILKMMSNQVIINSCHLTKRSLS